MIDLPKEIEIQGCIEVPLEVTYDEVCDKFISFVKGNNWYFDGRMREIIDDYYIEEDGTRGKHVMDDVEW